MVIGVELSYSFGKRMDRVRGDKVLIREDGKLRVAEIMLEESAFTDAPILIRLFSTDFSPSWGRWCKESELEAIGAGYKVNEWVEL